jgi:hypothetical protein
MFTCDEEIKQKNKIDTEEDVRAVILLPVFSLSLAHSSSPKTVHRFSRNFVYTLCHWRTSHCNVFFSVSYNDE